MGSSTKKTKQTQTYAPPSWVEDASQDAIALGRKIGDRQYTPYTGERVAGLSSNEKQGYALASSSAGGWKPYIDNASAALRRGSQQFTDANMQAYMNPYIKGALDPAARELREQGALRISDLQSNQAQRNAFGGSRGALLESEANRGLEEGISDLYGRGYAAAFESGANRWSADREAAFRESAGWQHQANLFRDATSADIGSLMQTGRTSREIQQAMKDFDYQQFTEGRDWDVKNLSGLIAAIQGVHGSYGHTTTTKTTEKTSGNAISQVIGVASLIAGAMTGNPAMMMGGAGMAGGDQGPTVGSGSTSPAAAAFGN